MPDATNGNSNLFSAMKWRCIGPFRGGRVVAVAGDPTNPGVFYFGAVAGGVWKTVDAGTYWECISDGYFNTSAVGALAVSEADPNVIYAGTGETTIRIDVSHGDGVYKSIDAGNTWEHMGLEDTRFIGEIVIHPENPDIVFVAALGHAFGPNKARGVYRSTDGGKTWQIVLFRSEKAGAVDLSIDIQNPRIIYATIWEAYRNFWQISSGGPDSSIYRSTDGGDTWTEITHNEGLPKGPLGKIGVAASPAQTGRVWALIEAKGKRAGLYRSDNYGGTWEKVSGNMHLLSRAWYYVHINADPQDPDTVYVNNLKLWKSIDAGHTFSEITTPHGDNHDIWIDPNNPQRMVQGNDGGANVSFNGGASWTTIFNQPTAQFYHLTTDNQFPYRVYGTQQDNSSVSVPSRSDNGAILWGDCYPAGTGESGYIAVHPEDPNIVFVGAVGSSPGGGGALQRYDHHSKQIRLVTVWPEMTTGLGAETHQYRFQWTFPILFSPHDPNVLYATGNVAFKTIDQGTSWEPISPDLTRNDPDKLKPTGGPLNRDAVGAETYATIFAFAESPHEPGVLWAGSDDGLMHISKDSGKNWENITPRDLPEWTLISIIEPSPHDPATAYVAATRYKLDDYAPYLYKTTDYGQTWTAITSGIPADDFTRVIREDPTRQGLLYAGTETGLYVSFNGGDSWEKFQLNLPVTPIHDMVIKENDLVVATHGRSFWILDDLTPLHQISDAITAADAHLFAPRKTVRFMPQTFADWLGEPNFAGKRYMISLGVKATFLDVKSPDGGSFRRIIDAGENPPDGAIVTYHLKEKPGDGDTIRLAFLNNDGTLIREFTNKPPQDDEEGKKEPDEHDDKVYIPANSGLNRFVWNLRYEDTVKINPIEPEELGNYAGPLVAPGTYQVRLTVGGQSQTQTFEIVKDPRTDATQADLQEQFDFWLKLHTKVSETHTTINQMRYLRQQCDEWSKRAEDHEKADTIKEAAKLLKAQVLEIEETLMVPGLRPGWTDNNNAGIRLAAKLAGLRAVIFSGDGKPTRQSYEVYDHLSSQIDEQIENLNELILTNVAAFNALIAESGIDAVVPIAPTPEL